MKNKLKILHLEDTPFDAEMVARELTKANIVFEELVVDNKDDFIEGIKDFDPDIILSDHSLAAFDSLKALELSKFLSPETPFILVTSTVSEEFAADIIKLGATDYILKDRLKRLPAAITAAIKQAEAEKEKREAEKRIAESENNLRTIFENASEGFLLMDKNGIIKAFNKKSEEYAFFVKEKKMHIGDSIFEFIREARKLAFNQIITNVLKGDSIQYDLSSKGKNGIVKCVDFCITPVIEKGHVNGICITGRDITDKKAAELQKEFASNNLKSLINNTKDLMWSVDNDLKMITCNDAFNKIFELVTGDRIETGDKVLSEKFAKETYNRYLKLYERALSGEAFTVIENYQYETDYWVEISFYPIWQDGTVIGTACFSRDITERKKAEENLLSLERKILEQKIQEQKKITLAMLHGQEKERNYIGQELHDNINQILAGTKLYLSSAAKKNDTVRELIKYPLELIDNSIEEMRLLCRSLVTPLKNIDLRSLIKDLMEKFKGTDTKTVFNYDVPDTVIADDVKLNIYRIIQEQMNNILKYAEAKIMGVSIKLEGNNILIDIADNGKGFDSEKKRDGIGISNMINRVESFNGEIEIFSSPGNGCKIMIRIPY